MNEGDWEKFIGPWKGPAPKPIKVTKIEMDPEGLHLLDGQNEPSKWEGFKFVQTDKLPMKKPGDTFWERIG